MKGLRQHVLQYHYNTPSQYINNLTSRLMSKKVYFVLQFSSKCIKIKDQKKEKTETLRFQESYLNRPVIS